MSGMASGAVWGGGEAEGGWDLHCRCPASERSSVWPTVNKPAPKTTRAGHHTPAGWMLTACLLPMLAVV